MYEFATLCVGVLTSISVVAFVLVFVFVFISVFVLVVMLPREPGCLKFDDSWKENVG